VNRRKCEDAGEDSNSTKVDQEVAVNDQQLLNEVETQETVEADSSESSNNSMVQKIVDSNTAVSETAAPDGPFAEAESVAKDEVKAELVEQETVASESTEEASNTEPSENTTPSEEETAQPEAQQALLNDIVEPIWMDQELGDFKSLEADGVVFTIMPSSSDGIQGENPNKVVTTKNDKFGTQTISADYNYQQMPMYNGGYYIAPMPSYLMRSVLPSKVGNSEK